MEGWQVLLLYLLIGLSVIAGISLITSWLFGRKLGSKTITRGANGVGGQTVTMTCPSGMNISLQNSNKTAPRAVYVCTNPDSNNFEDPTCDPYYTPQGQLQNYFNPATTQDQTNQLISSCAGKQTCSVQIPSSISNICNGGPCTGTVQLIATYDCVPN